MSSEGTYLQLIQRSLGSALGNDREKLHRHQQDLQQSCQCSKDGVLQSLHNAILDFLHAQMNNVRCFRAQKDMPSPSSDTSSLLGPPIVAENVYRPWEGAGQGVGLGSLCRSSLSLVGFQCLSPPCCMYICVGLLLR